MKNYKVQLDSLSATVEASDESEAIRLVKVQYGVAYAAIQAAREVVDDEATDAVQSEDPSEQEKEDPTPTKPSKRTRKG